MRMLSSIYALSCSCHPQDGVRYVGQSAELPKRVAMHKWRASSGHPLPVYKWIRKHSWENVVVTVLEECLPGVIDERESYWIKEKATFGTPNGLNCNSGGGGNSGWRHSPETIEHLKERVFTDEHRSRIGEASKKKWEDPEYRDRVYGEGGAWLAKDRSRSEESVEQSREFMLQWWQDNPQARIEMSKRMSRVMTGVPKSPEHVEKMRQASTGRVVPLAVRQKMSRTRSKNGIGPLLLTDSDAEAIIQALHAKETPAAIASRFDITSNTISLIKTGKAFPHLERPWADGEIDRFLTEDKVIAIIQGFSDGLSFADIQARFGITRGAAEKIKYAVTWKHLTRPWRHSE